MQNIRMFLTALMAVVGLASFATAGVGLAATFVPATTACPKDVPTDVRLVVNHESGGGYIKVGYIMISGGSNVGKEIKKLLSVDIEATSVSVLFSGADDRNTYLVFHGKGDVCVAVSTNDFVRFLDSVPVNPPIIGPNALKKQA